MHHPPHFPPLPRLSPSNKKRANVEQRFNTPKGFISSNIPPTPLFFRQSPPFPPFSHLHTSASYFPFPFSSYHAHPLFFRQYPHFPPFSHLHISAPYFPFPFSSDHARSLLFPPISSFPAIFSFAHFRHSYFPFHQTTPTPYFFRQYPNFPPFSHLHISAPLTSLFPFHHSTPILSFSANILISCHFLICTLPPLLLPFSLFIRPRPLLFFPTISPLSLFFLPTLPNLSPLLSFFPLS